ncbi:hypothetical protein INR49_005505 [Caranx melampygus]|nr:hypothetical protein INR49_005505 [Caranx melampygus]
MEKETRTGKRKSGERGQKKRRGQENEGEDVRKGSRCSSSPSCVLDKKKTCPNAPSLGSRCRQIRGGREGYTMQVNVNDYLDIYCPHYNDSQRMVGTGEQYVLYMVSYRGYRSCDPQLGFKRWECNRPHAPHAPIKFSEKFQRYSAFSLGYEFHVGQEYYYISTPTHHHGRSCLRLRVYVCCSTVSDVDDEPEPTEPDYTLRPGLKIDDIDDFNPFVPKLEKSVSGSSPSRDRLLLTVTMLLLAVHFIS